LKSFCFTSTEKVYCGIVLDEMHIRKQVIFDGKKMTGYINYAGIIAEPDPKPEAGSALFIMITGINKTLKVPLGYILTHGLSVNLQSAVVKKALVEVHKIGLTALTLTWDGLQTNFGTAERLGANLNPESPSFRPYIDHPTTTKRVYIVFDPPHMVKLIRNSLEHFKYLVDGQNRVSRRKY